jgi:hypothetical protein
VIVTNRAPGCEGGLTSTRLMLALVPAKGPRDGCLKWLGETMLETPPSSAVSIR